MPTNNLLTFTPYLGDTFLSSAVARKIETVTGDKPNLVSLNQEMAEIIVGSWEGSCAFSPQLSSFIKEGSLWSNQAEMKSSRRNGKWVYSYKPKREYENYIHKLASEIMKDFKGDTIYTLHNTYPHAVLGRKARQMGIKVRGYFLSADNTLYVETPNGVQLAEIWTNEFIGDRISRYATGRPLSKEDFRCIYSESPLDKNTVTLFPSTRSKTLNAGHWDIDYMYLKELGFDVRVATHVSEDSKYNELPLVSQVQFTDTRELVSLITSSEFIICNDSIPFHLAWHYGIKAVVKMKGGFNKEWQPRWTRNNPNYQFIPPSNYFKEEYLYLLEKSVGPLL